MMLVIDIGNTRTKWALANSAGEGLGALSHFDACLNADLAQSGLLQAAKQVNKVVVANVAGNAIAQQLVQLLSPLNICFITASPKACGVSNHYNQPEKLGSDRWAAVIAAWHTTHKPTIVVNAGTAITIDVLDEKGVFLGGTIMPGLRLMRAALSSNTANLELDYGEFVAFPNNTQNAIETGCVNAAIGAIMLMLNRMQTKHGNLLELMMTGGDADKLMEALKAQQKQVIITPYLVPHLVLQGLVLLERECV